MKNSEWKIIIDKEQNLQYIRHVNCRDKDFHYGIAFHDESCDLCEEWPPNYIRFQYQLLVS